MQGTRLSAVICMSVASLFLVLLWTIIAGYGFKGFSRQLTLPGTQSLLGLMLCLLSTYFVS